MYRNLAVANGALLAVMIFLNGALANRLGVYGGTLVYHSIGLALLIPVALVRRPGLSGVPWVSPVLLLPGVLSVVTIALNNLTIPKIGVTLASGIALFGQLVMSAVIEHFGLFGTRINRLKKGKIAGFLVISAGVAAMILL